jgi:hypothetical protein
MANYNPPAVGFHNHPEMINRNGRPKKDWTWAGLIEEAVEQFDAADESMPAEKRKKIKYKVVSKVIEKALGGDMAAFQVMANRTDGNPTDTKNINTLVVVAPLSKNQQAQLSSLLELETYDEEKYPDAIEAESEPAPDTDAPSTEDPAPEADNGIVPEEKPVDAPQIHIIEQNNPATPSESESNTIAPLDTDVLSSLIVENPENAPN